MASLYKSGNTPSTNQSADHEEPTVGISRLELSEGKTHKFYEVEVEGCELRIRYGRIGQKGQSQTKAYPTEAKAEADAQKKLKSKMDKGYSLIAQEEDSAPSAPSTPKKTSAPKATSKKSATSAANAPAMFVQPNKSKDFQAPARWVFETGACAFGISADAQGCWVGNEDGLVCRLSHEGELLLQYALPAGVKCIVSDDVWLYAGCDNGKVYDLSGKVPFVAYDIPNIVDIHWLDILDGSLAVSDAIGQVSALDHEGDLLWQRKGERTSGWMVRCDELGVFHGHAKGLVLYDWVDGHTIWEQPLSRSVLFGWREASSVFVATSGSKIHQFSKQGEEWEMFRCDASVFSCTAAHDGDIVFAGDNAGYVYCFSGDGTRVWKAKTGCGAAQSMHYYEGLLYIVTARGHLACLDISTEALAAAYQGEHQAPEAHKPSAAQASVAWEAAPEVEATDEEDGILLECYKKAGKLRVRVLSDGYEADWNVQFPKALREEGARFYVDAVKTSAKGGFYRTQGDIKKVSS